MVLYASLSPDRKATFLTLDRALTSPFIQVFWFGNDCIVFMVTTSSTHLLIYDVTDDVYSSIHMWFSWVAASLNMCQSVHSKQSCRAAVASFVLTVFSDDLTPLYHLRVSRQEKQENMICLTKMGTGEGFVAARNVHVIMVQGIVAPCGGVDMLVQCR